MSTDVADVLRAIAALTPQEVERIVTVLRASSGSPREGGAASSDPGASRSDADLLSVAEAAALLGVTPRWLYRHARTLPFTRKLSRKCLRFSRAGIERWLATKRL
ncbi:MAG: helix-turn-helix domain-containing protein [Candidatus Eisenbacteria bacterium]|nr:helix-turn-helix domain-containing protein [Candidatus Eisenbacteria bacterium]